MQNKSSLNMLPIGLLELDDDGTIIYFKPEDERASVCSSDIIGRNLFIDIAPIAEDVEFRERVSTFRRRHAPADSFHFTFNSGQSYIAVKVLLARIHEQSVLGNMESILIHIRRQADRIAA